MKVEDLFKNYYIQLVLYVFRIVKIRSVAEDIVQDAFLKVLEKHQEKEVDIQYLYVAVRHLAFNYLRDTRYLINEIPDNNLSDTEVDIEGELLYVQHLKQIYMAVEKLPPACRQVFKEVYWGKRKYIDVANELNVSVNTVKSHMYMALATLKKSLK